MIGTELDFNPLAALGGQTCGACGAENARTAWQCEACGAAFEDDEEAFEVMAADGVVMRRRLPRVPREQASNLLALRGAVQGWLDGSLDPAAYQARVAPVRNVARLGVDLFKTDLVRKHSSRMPENEAALVSQTATQFGAYLAGTERMLDAGSLADAMAGLAQVEEAFIVLERIREAAFEISESQM
ncbi:MAG: hypothetical protein ACYCW6_03665 [Candidatus Xenobia bacterium]